jgi:hypothetical protein
LLAGNAINQSFKNRQESRRFRAAESIHKGREPGLPCCEPVKSAEALMKAKHIFNLFFDRLFRVRIGGLWLCGNF